MVAVALARPAAIAGITLLADGASVSAVPLRGRSVRAPPFRDSENRLTTGLSVWTETWSD
jgi:hypothetical protein